MQSQTLSHQNLTRALQAAGRGVRPEELEACAHLMARAFHDDPAIRYLLGGTDLGPEDWRYFYTVLRAVYGKCMLLSTDDRLENLLILFPPRLKSVPALAFFRRGGGKLWRHFGLGLYVRSLRYEAHCGRVREKCAPPEAWYCMCLVVSPEVQGRGQGSRLLKPALECLRRAGVPLYLETHKPVNTQIYAHLGFRQADVSTIPGTDVAQYAMMKPGTP